MTYTLDTIDLREPIIPAYGAGVDSTAMIIGLVQRGVPLPAILFANTGDEKPETIEYVDIFSRWLQAHGYPGVTTVAYKGNHDRYTTLGGSCLANQVMPSLAYGGKSCSIKFKREVQEAFLFGKGRGPNKKPGFGPAVEALASGLKVIRAIGYDAGAKDSRRSEIPEDARCRYIYPLREWKMDRLDCVKLIISVGLPVPVKSACYFCPASKPLELFWLHAHHPDLFMRALEIEEVSRHRFTTVEGLWRKSTKSRPGSWVAWAIREGLVQRNADGNLVLIPAQGPLPSHPDDELIRLASLKAAA